MGFLIDYTLDGPSGIDTLIAPLGPQTVFSRRYMYMDMYMLDSIHSVVQFTREESVSTFFFVFEP